MVVEVRAFDNAHRLGESTSRPIAGLPSRLAALLLLAGPGPLRRRALPADSADPHSDAIN